MSRIDEIEKRLAEYRNAHGQEHHDEANDVDWLIARVRKLRSALRLVMIDDSVNRAMREIAEDALNEND